MGDEAVNATREILGTDVELGPGRIEVEPDTELVRVVSDPAVRGGEPCLEGTRMPTAAVYEFWKQGGRALVREAYPHLSEAQITSAVLFETREVEVYDDDDFKPGDAARICRGVLAGLVGTLDGQRADGRWLFDPSGSEPGHQVLVNAAALELVSCDKRAGETRIFTKGVDIGADRIEVDLPNGWTPFVAGEHCKPGYYRQVRRHPLIDENVDVEDMLYVFVDCPRIAEAIRHLIRAGRKPGEPRAKDISKAMEFLQRELSFEAMQGEEVFGEMEAGSQKRGE